MAQMPACICLQTTHQASSCILSLFRGPLFEAASRGRIYRDRLCGPMPEIAKQDDGFALGGHDGGVFADGEYVLKLWQPGHNGETEVLLRPNSRNGTHRT